MLESASSNDKSCEPSLSSNSFFLLCFLCLCFLCFFCSGNSFVSEIHQLHSFSNLITITDINLALNNTLSNKKMCSNDNELRPVEEYSCSLLAYCRAQSRFSGNIEYITQQISTDVNESKNAFSYLSGDMVVRMKHIHLDNIDAKSNYFILQT